jgi:chemotaxis protein MotA
MEITTGIGLILGVGAMIVTMIIEGGNPLSLLNLPAAVIVFVGCGGALFVSFPMGLIMKMPVLVGQSFKASHANIPGLIDQFVTLADLARREGLLALEGEIGKIEDAFIKKGVMLIVDGLDPTIVREILETDISLLAERHKEGQEMFKALGGYAPTFGIIGTVMGLINVLSHLSEPEKLGHSIAVAFIATLYGVASANILWLPMGNKLKVKTQHEVMARELSAEGVLAIQAGENPRIVREKLESYLPPKLRGVSESSKGE